MIKLMKKTTFMLVLGCGLVLSQNTMAHEDDKSQEAATPTTLSTNYASKKAEVNDLIAQDPAKNFAYQVKRHAKARAGECSCHGCSHYLVEAKELWSKIRNADTNSVEGKGHFQKFANCQMSVSRLPQSFSSWLQEHGYTVATPSQATTVPTLSFGFPGVGMADGGLGKLFAMMMIRDMLSGGIFDDSSDDEGAEVPTSQTTTDHVSGSDSDSEDGVNLEGLFDEGQK